MTPLKIEIELATPFVKSGFPLHLDSLVAYAYQRHYLGDEALPDEQALMAIVDDLPIEKHVQEGDWVYKASALVPEGTLLHGSRFLTRRYSDEDTAIAAAHGKIKYGKYKPGTPQKRHAQKIDTQRGPQKNILAYYPTTECQRMVAYCIGDKPLLEEALCEWGYISHVGAQRRMGHGLVKAISLTEDDTALNAWQIRTMPWAINSDMMPLTCTTRNPYFYKRNMKPAYCHVAAL